MGKMKQFREKGQFDGNQLWRWGETIFLAISNSGQEFEIA